MLWVWVQGFGFRVQGSFFWLQSLGLGAWGFGVVRPLKPVAVKALAPQPCLGSAAFLRRAGDGSRGVWIGPVLEIRISRLSTSKGTVIRELPIVIEAPGAFDLTLYPKTRSPNP